MLVACRRALRLSSQLHEQNGLEVPRYRLTARYWRAANTCFAARVGAAEGVLEALAAPALAIPPARPLAARPFAPWHSGSAAPTARPSHAAAPAAAAVAAAAAAGAAAAAACGTAAAPAAAVAAAAAAAAAAAPRTAASQAIACPALPCCHAAPAPGRGKGRRWQAAGSAAAPCRLGAQAAAAQSQRWA